MARLLGIVALVFALASAAAPAAGGAPDSATLAAEMPTPSCAEGPQREGDVIVGTPCADHIVVPPTVTYVDGGPGNDVIEGSLTTAASTAAVTAASGSCEVECHLEVGSQTFEGGSGDDIVYGDRGNDILRGTRATTVFMAGSATIGSKAGRGRIGSPAVSAPTRSTAKKVTITCAGTGRSITSSTPVAGSTR
jgi:hypothetical protein